MATKTKMAVTKTVTVNGKNQRENVGEVEFTLFHVGDFIPSIGSPDKTLEDGTLVYSDAKVQAVQDALEAAVKAVVRNRLQPGSVELKEGATIPATVEEYMAGATGGAGAFMTLHKAFIETFDAFLAKTVNDASRKVYLGLVALTSRKVLAESSAARKEKLAEKLEAFVAELTQEQAEAFGGIIQTIHGLCQAAPTLLDADLE